MIITTAMLLDELHDYRYPANKLARMVAQGKIFPVVRGLYTTDDTIPGHLLAASIYGPSYLSFDYALSYWHLIPEAVYTFTSATYDKKKRKQFKTDFGLFTYRDVPKTAYPVGIQIVEEGDYSFLIALPEKALCDKLYTLSPAVNMRAFENLLWDDLRIDRDTFRELDKDKIIQYATLYQTGNHKRLIQYLRRIA
ncbi:MAG: type IV toxin-antitoxin system AbiEi family antitoxin domain-containing protein [Saccharofermentanales bacterium]|jgi:hypothetical protein|nr:hypothetical protein [Clostridiaceae bacterium]